MTTKIEIRPGLSVEFPDHLFHRARNVALAHSDDHLAFFLFDWEEGQPVPIVAVNLDGQTAKKVVDDLEKLRKSPKPPKWLRTRGN